jgi:MoxR-like ATPase
MTLTEIHQSMQQVRSAIQQVIVGQEDVIDGVLIGLLAGGHVLLESVPGLGKTLLVKTLSTVLDVPFTRLQCTPDTTPTDILGTANAPGPIFTNLLLVDEINRAQPKTQAALLEAMQERKVTLGGISHPLPAPFMVFATQNPVEQEGTFPLPEAQLDRFFFQLHVPFPTEDELITIGQRTTQGFSVTLAPLLNASQLCAMQAAVQAMPVSREIYAYAAHLVLATHPEHIYATQAVRRTVLYGASPRGLQALVLAAKVQAVMAGRMIPDMADIDAVAIPALQHRTLLSYEGAATGVVTADLITTLIGGSKHG